MGFIGYHLLNVLHYLYLTRVACIGLLAMLLLPLLACGPLRTSVLGAYDARTLPGALIIGFSLVITVGCLIHQRKLVDMHGDIRFDAPVDTLKPGMVRAWNWIASIAVLLNMVVVLRASNRELWPMLLKGLIAGACCGIIMRAGLGRIERKLVDLRHGWPADILSFLVSNGLCKSPGLIELRDKDKPFSFTNVTLADGHLSVLAYGSLLVIIFLVVDEGVIHPLASLLLLICVLSLLLSSVAFILDRHRVPLMAGIVAYCTFTNLWRESDHYYPVLPRAPSAPALPTPAGIVEKSIEEHRPLVIVSTAGGGIQSAAWTTRVLEQLEVQMAAAGSPGFHDSVRLISGVSGGSVGALHYAYAVGMNPSAPDLDNAAKAASASSLTEAVVGMVKKDLLRATFPSAFTSEEMLFNDRGRMLEYAWAENAELLYGFGGLEHATLERWAADALKLVRPALIFNSTIVETGERMAISTSPRSPLGYLQPPRAGNFEFTERYIADIPMLTAARLSATFPLISPAARPAISDGKGNGLILPGTENAGVFPVGGSLHHAVDGGYFENSGMVGALEWLDEALTTLSKAGRELPDEVMVIELAAFPAPPADPMRLTPVDLGRTSQGALYDVLSPGLTMMHVRNSSQSAYAGQLLAQFSLRWQLELESKYQRPPGRPFIRHVRLLPKTPMPPTENDQRGILQRFADWFFIPADMMKAPLSWHLRPSEIAQIDSSAREAVSTMLQTKEILPQTAIMAQQQLVPPQTTDLPAPVAAPPPTMQPIVNPGSASAEYLVKPQQLNRDLLKTFISPKSGKTEPAPGNP
ncbi:hypothetical protein BGE01nite_03990 [Brevifollis gellanilyticus]|uniref:PNPLA domain-containing protein n=1 Tax=Brevifollis gellanilyticus TaxID=748831 RepID=A0A512M342_9BACT|nr:hypothetical protein BGE01nite_03990 [Brevifollis gellanilyticus]